ncbi:MAG: hypothetical protein JXC32_17695 [Anaerolineae bacterium]|nr:hypothetical protein [Anaerolineae bacterium]
MRRGVTVRAPEARAATRARAERAWAAAEQRWAELVEPLAAVAEQAAQPWERAAPSREEPVAHPSAAVPGRAASWQEVVEHLRAAPAARQRLVERLGAARAARVDPR